MSESIFEYDFDKSVKKFIPVLDNQLDRMKADLSGRNVSDYVNLMIYRSELASVHSYYFAAIKMVPLILGKGSRDDEAYGMIVESVDEFFYKYRKAIVDLCCIRMDCSFELEISEEAAACIETMAFNLHEFFDTMGAWKITERD